MGDAGNLTEENENSVDRTCKDKQPSDTELSLEKIFLYIRAFYFFIMTMYVVPVASAASIIAITPLIYLKLNLYNTLEHYLCKQVTDIWVSIGWLAGLRVVNYGKRLGKYSEEHCLNLVNHLGLADHFLVLTSLRNTGSVGNRWMWVIFNMWKWTPIGIMWTMHGSFFVKAGKSTRNNFMIELKDQLKKIFKKFEYGWIIMYPEGSRLFLIRDSANRFAEKEGLPPLHNCAYPRMGVANVVMDVLGPKEDGSENENGEIKYIVDTTLGYPKGEVMDLKKAIMGEYPNGETRVAVYSEVFEVDPKWKDEEELKKWMYKQYQKKDKLLEEFYRTGSFPGEGDPQEMSKTDIFITNAFWWICYLVHHYLWISPLLSLAFRAVGI